MLLVAFVLHRARAGSVPKSPLLWWPLFYCSSVPISDGIQYSLANRISHQTASMAAEEPASSRATTYLSTFLNRTLHLHTTDGRMFVGELKCTDPERNIILSMTHEYRQPTQADIQLAAERHEKAGLEGNVKVDMKKRFVGLVVVPGRYITRIEVEG